MFWMISNVLTSVYLGCSAVLVRFGNDEKRVGWSMVQYMVWQHESQKWRREQQARTTTNQSIKQSMPHCIYVNTSVKDDNVAVHTDIIAW